MKSIRDQKNIKTEIKRQEEFKESEREKLIHLYLFLYIFRDFFFPGDLLLFIPSQLFLSALFTLP